MRYYETNKLILARISCVLIIALFFAPVAHAQSAAGINGLNWLKSTQKSDGSWGGQNNFRDTSTVIDSYKSLGQSDASYQSALGWINSASIESNDYISRRIISLSGTGSDGSADLQNFILSQNSDGGWGYFPGFASNAYDTALTLFTLKKTQFHSPNAVSKAVAYLLTNQNPDGSWSVFPYSPSDLTTTSLAVVILKSYGSSSAVFDPVNKAVAWLLSKQNPDGGFGDSPSTIHGTRFALMALLASGQIQAASLQSAVNYVTTSQLSDGSWGDNPYETAMAVQMLADLKPNLSIAASDLQISNVTPKSGEIARISATIRNTGSEAVSTIPVQILYETLDHQTTQTVATQTIGQLGVGESATVEASIDTRAMAGSYHILVAIDKDNTIEELSKEDNQASIQISIIPVADLAISNDNLVFSKNPVSLGENVTITATVSNQGTYSARNVEVSFYHDAVLTENLIGSSVIPLLDAGMTASRNVIWKANEVGPSIPIYAVVDPRNFIDESKKDNNQAVKLVGVDSVTGTNLSISYKDISLNPAIAMQGGSVEISAVIKNDGTLPVGSVEVGCYEGDPAAGGILLDSKTIQGMTPGTSATVAFNWSNIVGSGEKPIYIKVDPSNSIPESSKDDNIAFKALKVISLPDLVIAAGSIAFMPPAPREGETVSIGITVRNAGGQDARNFKITAYEGTAIIGSQDIELLSGYSLQNFTFSFDTTGKVGIHEITVVADPDNAVIELSKNNNRAARSFGVNNANTWLTEQYISPNGDGIKDSTIFSFRLDMPQTVNIVAVNKNDEIVRTFSGSELENTAGGNITWNGLNDAGKVVDDGRYRLQVRIAEKVLQEASVVVDTDNSTIADAVAAGNLLFNDLICTMPSEADYVAFRDNAVWLPDGRGALYHVQYDWRYEQSESLKIVSPNGKDIQKITSDDWLVGDNREIMSFTPSPDGQKIAILARKSLYSIHSGCYPFPCKDLISRTSELWVMDSDGSNLKLLDSKVMDMLNEAKLRFSLGNIDEVYPLPLQLTPQWSSDNETISYYVTWWNGYIYQVSPYSTYGTDLYSVNINTQTMTKLSSYSQQSSYAGFSPTRIKPLDYKWSPDGKSVAVLQGQKYDYYYRYYLSTIDNDGAVNNVVPIYTNDTYYNPTLSSWLDNSSMLIQYYGNILTIVDVVTAQTKTTFRADKFISLNGKVAYMNNKDLRVFDMKTNSDELLVSLPSSSYYDTIVASPDFKKIAFESEYKIGVVTVDTKEVTIFNNEDFGHGASGVWDIVWPRDNGYLVAEVLLDTQPGRALFLVDVKNGQKTFLTDGYFDNDYYGAPIRRFYDIPAYKNYIYYGGWNYDQPDPQFACIQKGNGNGAFWTMSSSANLTAELFPVKGDSEIVLRGTAADLNFEGYKLDYASFDAPLSWLPIVPFSDLQIQNETLAIWVPPGEGTYYVRLTAWDKAGNVAENKQKVAWTRSSSSITNIYLSRDLFSPNGDGVMDTVELHYRVLEPISLEFAVYDETNNLLRTFIEDRSVPGEYYISWDGRDEAGKIVPDGRYRIRVLDYDFIVAVDNTLPEVSLFYSGGWDVDPVGIRVSLKATAMDNNFEHWRVDVSEMTPAGITWKPVTDGTEQLIPRDVGAGIVEIPIVADGMLVDAVTGRDFRIVAKDKAGNQSIKVLKSFSEQIYLIPQILNDSTMKMYASETVVQQIDYVIVQWRYPPPPGVDDGSGWVDDIILNSDSNNLSNYFNFDWNYLRINLLPLEFRIKAVDQLGTVVFSNAYVLGEDGILELSSGKFIAIIGIKPPSMEDPDHYIFTVFHNLDVQNWMLNLDNPSQHLYSVPLPPPGVTDISVGKEFFELCRIYFMKASATSPDNLAVYREGYPHKLTVPCLDIISGYLEADNCNTLSQKLSVNTSVKLIELSDQELKELSIGISATSAPLSNIATISEFKVDLPVFGKKYSTVFDVSSLPVGAYTLFERVKYRDVKANRPTDKETVGYTTINVDKTLPTAEITYPGQSQKICPVRNLGQTADLPAVPVQGVVADNGTVKYYELFYGVGVGGVASIPTGFKGLNAVDGQIGVWGLPDSSDSAYSVKLKVVDGAGNTGCYTTEFFVDRFVEISSLTTDQIIFSPKIAEVSINYEIPDEALVDIKVYRTLQDTDSLRTIVSALQHSGGTGVVSWNGRDDNGTVVPDGQYSVVVSVVDSCGNTSQRAITVEVDNTPPNIIVTYPNSSGPLGGIVEVRGSASDLHFKNYVLDVGQSDNPAAWVTIYSGEAQVSDDILGNWNTFGLEGRWTLRLTAVDTVGNNAATEVTIDFGQRHNIIRDLAVSTVFLSPNNDGRLDSTTLNYTLSDACQVTLNITDATELIRRTFSALTSSSGSYAFVWNGEDNSGSAVQDGIYSARLNAVLSSDPSFNQEEVIKVTVDSTPPSIDIVQPINGSYIHGDVEVSGSIIDQNLFEYSVNYTGDKGTVLFDQGIKSRENYVFGAIGGLSDGDYSLSIKAKDRAENTTERNVIFTVDNTLPTVTLNGPKTGEIFGLGKNIIAITGSIIEKNLDSFVLRYGQGDDPLQWTELARGNILPVNSQLLTWNVGSESGIPDGLYTISLYAQDKAGQTGEARVRVIVDNLPPVAAISSPQDGDYIKSAFGIQGTADAGALDKYIIEISQGICSSAAKWSSLKTSTLPVTDGLLASMQALPSDGKYCIRLTTTDKLGNKSEARVNITVDTHPPEAPVLSGQIQNKQDINLNWTQNSEPDLAGYNLFKDGIIVNTSLMTGTAYLGQNLTEGTYIFTVKAVDSAGNESLFSNEVKLKIDLTPPDAKIRLPLDGSMVSGIVNITGTAYSIDDFKQYRVFIGQGQNPSSWNLLRASPVAISNNMLVQWDTAGLQGHYSIKLEAEDLAGNVNTHQISVTLDFLPPAAPILLSATPDGSNVTLTWIANTESDLAGYLLLRNGQIVNAPSVPGDFKLYLITGTTYLDKTMPDGTFKYYLIAVDRAGNLSGQSNSLEVNLDIHAPHAGISEPKSGSSFQDKILVKAETPDIDIASVQFQYKMSSAASWLNLGSPVSQAPFSTYLDPLALGMVYGGYQLRAVAIDKGGKTDPAPSSIFVSYTDLTAPNPPQNLKTATNGADILLSWTANTEADLDGYNVYIKSWSNLMRAYHIKDLSYLDNGLPNDIYTYVVTAVDVYGNESKPSNEALAKIYAPVLTQPYTPIGQKNISISGGNVSGDTPVEIFRATEAGILSGGIVTADTSGNFVLPALDLILGENRISATATDSAGNVSKASDTAVVVYNEPPATPTGLALTVDGHNVGLSWTANSEADLAGYNLYRDGNKANISSPVTTGYVWSDIDYYYTASKAFDSDPATYWTYVSSVSPFSPVLWEIDLSSAELISHMELHWGAQSDYQGNEILYAGKDYEIQVWSGYAWITHTKVSGNNVKDNSFDFAIPYRTAKIRILVTDTTDPSGMRIMMSEVGLIKDNLVTDMSYVDSNLHDGTYSYKLTAVDYYGFESSPTNDINTVVGDVIPPSTPSNLTATGFNSSVTLGWDQNTENDLTGYNLYRNTAQGWIKINTSLITTNAYADPGLMNGTYVYRVTAVDSAGNESPASNEAMAVVSISLLEAPDNLSVHSLPEGGLLALSWEYAGNPAGYNLYRGTSSGGPYTRINGSSLTATAYTDKGLTNGVTYYYVVVALDSLTNESAYSNEVQGRPSDVIAPLTPEIMLPTTSEIPIVLYQDMTDISGNAEPGTSVDLLRNGGFVGRTTASDEYVAKRIPVDYWLYEASLAPDGKSMIYVYNDSILIRDLVTGEETLAVQQGRSPIWSPDGSRVLYSYWDNNWYYRIFLYDRNTGTISQLTDDPYVYEFAASWSSDGNNVAFIRSTGANDIWIKDLSSGSLTQVTQNINASAVRLSPDANKLAYFEYQNLSIVNLATGETSLIDSQADSSSVSWSPDSNTIAFISNRNGNNDIYTLNIATMHVSRITSTLDDDLNPVWFPDGNNIAFARAENNGSGYSIRIADAKANGPEIMVQENIGYVESVFLSGAGNVGYKVQDAFYIMHFGRFIFNAIPLNINENIFSVIATDSSGNKSPESKSISVTVAEISKPDLAIIPESFVAYPSYPIVGEQVIINIDVTNSGQVDAWDVDAELYMSDPSGGVSLLKSITIPYIAAGTIETIGFAWDSTGKAGKYTIIAVADPLNRIDESDKINNLLTKDIFVVIQEGILMTTITDLDTYLANQDVKIHVTLMNSGIEKDVTVATSLEDSNGNNVMTLAPINSHILYDSQLDFDLLWNTGVIFAGSYNVHTILTDGINPPTENKVSFTILPDINVDTIAVTEKAIYGPREDVIVSINVKNKGLNYIIPGLKVKVRMLDAGNNELFTENKDIANLWPGISVATSAKWNTGLNSSGDYRAVVETYLADRLISTNSVMIRINASAIISGEIAVSPSAVLPGSTINADIKVSNNGSADANGLTIRLLVLDPETQTIISTSEEMLNLEMNGIITRRVSFSTAGYGPKTYVMVLQSLDQAGTSNLANASFTVRGVNPPSVVVISPSSGSYLSSQVDISVTASVGDSTIEKVEYQIDGGLWISLPLTDPTTSRYSTAWMPVKADEGLHTISVRAADFAGNTSETVSTTVTIDLTLPDLTVSTLSDGSWTNNQVLNISGVTTDNMEVLRITVNGVEIPLNPDGTFSYGSILASGANIITTTVEDLAGNHIDDRRTIYYDPTTPVIDITAPADNSKTNQSVITVSGTVGGISNVAIKVNNGSPVAVNTIDGSFSFNIIPVYGINTIEVTATDLAGNTSTLKRTVTFDNMNPSLSVTDPVQDMRTNHENMLIRGEAADLTAVAVILTMDNYTYTPALTDGRFEQSVFFTSEKTYQIYVTAMDEAGNETTVQRNVVYDITSPMLTLNPVTSPTSLASQILIGTVDADSAVSVTCTTATVSAVTYPTATTWTVTLTNIQEGNNEIVVTAIDEVGNVSIPILAIISVHPNITATIEVEPETLNRKSHGNWVTVEIELPKGYRAQDVDISSIRLEGVIQAEPWPYHLGCNHEGDGSHDDRDSEHHDGDDYHGERELMVKFRRSEVLKVLPDGNHVPVHVTGRVGAVTFEGVDYIRVIH